jgi:hypothetical protein
MKVNWVDIGLMSTLLIMLIWAVTSIKEPKMLTDVRERYDILLAHLRQTQQVDPRFEVLRRHEPLLTGIDSTRMTNGTIGYNVNKGYEIYMCIDAEGSLDAAMHVLIHELAHMTVPEYDHSDAYWQNFKDLRELCRTLGLLIEHSEPMTYCGGQITV